MKNSARRTNSFRFPIAGESPATSAGGGDSPLKSSSSFFWIVLHAACCLVSLLLGFRFSRLLFFLIFSPTSNPSPSSTTIQTLTLTQKTSTAIFTPPNVTAAASSHVVAGRHGILIRPWPHPNPTETVRALRILDRVQREQRAQYGVKSPRTIIAVTPTYSRTFQALHLTGLIHTLMLIPHDVTWIVIEAGGISNETSDLLATSKLNTIHLGFDQEMPVKWADRHKLEARMRIRALSEVRDRKLDGIVMFADESNMHSLELFDEIQKVKWMGAISVGILAHNGKPELAAEKEKENLPVPVQGPACNSSNQLAGWHTFNSLPYLGKSAFLVGDGGTVLPMKMEWSGFVLNSRLVWGEAEGKPDWVRDLDLVGVDGEEVDSPMVLLKDATSVEPLGSCGRKVMVWWLRVEARSDSRFPSRWIIDPPLEITVHAKRTPWPEASPELPKPTGNIGHVEKNPTKTGRSSRSRHGSRSKRKRESRAVNAEVSGVSKTQGTQ